MQRQLDHHQIQFEKKKFPLHLVLDSILDAKNVGSLFRLADALGVEAMHLCSDTPVPPHKAIRKTARNTDRYVSFFAHEDTLSCVESLKKDGFEVIALEITNESKVLSEVDFSNCSKVALVLGNEEKGIAAGVLESIEQVVHIPMYGVNSSMNVAAAASIAVHEIVRQMQR